MTQKELDKIIKDHQLWLNNNTTGKRADLRRADLSHADLYGANLSHADLKDADLEGANLRGANLYKANLRDANLFNANLYNANLKHANLHGANLSGANLYDANLRHTILDPTIIEGVKKVEKEEKQIIKPAQKIEIKPKGEIKMEIKKQAQKIYVMIKPYEKYLLAGALIIALDYFILEGKCSGYIKERAEKIFKRLCDIVDSGINKFLGE